MSDPGRDARLALLLRRQGGAFTFAQALDLGFPRATISRRLATGAWGRLHPGVFSVAGPPLTRTGALWAAVLAAGPKAVVSHESAALLHGAEGLALAPITLTNPHRWHHSIAGVMVHQIDDLRPAAVMTKAGLLVSTPARCIVELGATQGVEVVGRVADDLLRTRRTTLAAVQAELLRVARPGKPGMAIVGQVLDERGDGYVPPHSELERLLFATLAAGGLPAPDRQVPLPGRSARRGVADGAYRDAQMILEADGRRWHDRVEAARRDRERDAQVARAGWLTLRFLHEQLVGDPAAVCAVVAETRQRRLAQLRPAA